MGKLCNFCDEHTEDDLLTHQAEHRDELHKVRFSNDTKDVVKTKCRVCGKIERVTNLRNHTKTKHKMIITEYRERFNSSFSSYDLVEKVLHECGVCGLFLLLDSDIRFLSRMRLL